MTTIYFVRHVMATGNIDHVFQGAIDTDICEQGERQCQNLSEMFQSITLDAVYSSPLKRAIKTAEAVSCGRNEIQTVEDIIEINAGVWEGMPIEELGRKYAAEFRIWQSEPWNFQVEGSESMLDVYTRAKRGLQAILNQSIGKTIAVVSHGCCMRNILANAMGLTLEQLGEVGWVRNGGVTKMEFEDGVMPGKVIYENKTDHLDPDTGVNWGALYQKINKGE